MTRSLRLTNLVLRGQTYYARMLVPQDVQALLGRKVLIATTGQQDPARALVAAAPIIAAWKTQIAEARKGNLTPALEDRVRRLALEYRASQDDLNARDAILQDALELVTTYVTSGTHMDDLYAHPSQDAYKALSGVKGGDRAQAILDTVTGDRTPFLTRLDAWEATLRATMRGNGPSAYAREVRRFAEDRHVTSIEDVTRVMVRQWLEDSVLVRRRAPNTVKKGLQALSGYWQHLEAHGVLTHDDEGGANNPFKGHRMPRRHAEDQKRALATERQPFAVEDIQDLIAHAPSPIMRGLIALGAATGARIQELCDVRWDRDVTAETITIREAKTRAGRRVIPVTPAIEQALEALRSLRDAEGYVIPGQTASGTGGRSGTIGAAFSAYKTRRGYGPQHVFHSLRKTVATLLESVGCPEGIAADLLGHDKPTMTYGLYSGGASMDVRREWLEKATTGLLFVTD